MDYVLALEKMIETSATHGPLRVDRHDEVHASTNEMLNVEMDEQSSDIVENAVEGGTKRTFDDVAVEPKKRSRVHQYVRAAEEADWMELTSSEVPHLRMMIVDRSPESFGTPLTWMRNRVWLYQLTQ